MSVVFDAWGDLRIHGARRNAVAFELAQRFGQYLLTDAFDLFAHARELAPLGVKMVAAGGRPGASRLDAATRLKRCRRQAITTT